MILKIWIARNENGSLFGFQEKPERYFDEWIADNPNQIELPKEWAPNLKWKNEPIIGKIFLKRNMSDKIKKTLEHGSVNFFRSSL